MGERRRAPKVTGGRVDPGDFMTSSLTQQFIEEVQNVLPRRSGLLAGLLCEVGGTVVQVHPVDAPGQ